MSEHRVTTAWKREGKDFTYDSYNRNHVWRYGQRSTIEVSAAPEYKGDGERLDPEEAFVGSLSTCHLLTFLAIAARKRLTVDAYEDDAVGHMSKNADGELWVSEVTLRPRIIFAEGVNVTRAQLDQMHHQSHKECFIANSVKTDVRVEPRE